MNRQLKMGASRSIQIICLVFLSIMGVESMACAEGAKIDPQKRADILNLMTVNHSQQLAQQVGETILNQLFDNYRKTKPQVPEAFWQKSKAIILSEFSSSMNDLTEISIIAYDRHYTDEDIRGMTTFYQSSLGQKMIKETPQVMQEVMAAAKILGQQIAQRSRDRLRELGKQQGYNL